METDPAGWATEWLAYTTFNGFFITLEEFKQAPDAVRQALSRYVIAGGMIVVAGEGEFEPDWPLADSEWHHLPNTPELQISPVGSGALLRIPRAELWELESKTMAWLLQILSRESPGGSLAQTLAAAGALVKRPYDPSTEIKNEGFFDGINFTFPIGPMLFLLAVFSILAGPVAVFVLARKNRRIWLLWVVPAFSLAFSSVVFCYALLSEGITPYTAQYATTMLDQRQKIATTRGIVGVYMPAMRGDGLHFDRETEVRKNAPGSRHYYDPSDSRVRLRHGQDQHFTGLISPRVPAYFFVRRSETRMERLVITPAGEGKIEVVNALGAPILRMILCDANGWVYMVENLPSGGKAELQSTLKSSAGKDDEKEMLSYIRGRTLSGAEDWELSEKITLTKAQMAPGQYAAFLDGAPFVENPVKTKVKNNARSLVYGVF